SYDFGSLLSDYLSPELISLAKKLRCQNNCDEKDPNRDWCQNCGPKYGRCPICNEENSYKDRCKSCEWTKSKPKNPKTGLCPDYKNTLYSDSGCLVALKEFPSDEVFLDE
ncbi:21709_t:CDS:2, partial [Racocetra persica]